MKKTVLITAVMCLFSSLAAAAPFLTLGGDCEMFGKNTMLDVTSGCAPVYSVSAGWLWDSGFNLSLQYDRIDSEDYIVDMKNARITASVPGAGAGYAVKFDGSKWIWWTTGGLGCAQVRYRYNITDYMADVFVPSISTALYYQVKGRFYAGFELGYRYLNAKYDDLAGSKLDLSGMSAGLTIAHIFE